MLNKIKVAIVGMGHIGIRHAQIIENSLDFELIASCDPSFASSSLLENNKFVNLNDLLNSGLPIDVIVIATPNGLHASQAVKCLNNFHHVIIEKPIAINSDDANLVINTAKENKKNVFVVHQNRFSPVVLSVKKKLENDELGNICLVQINCFWNRDERYYKKSTWRGTAKYDGGVLFTQFSHYIDLMYWFFGDIKNINGAAINFNHQSNTDFNDTGVVQFEFEGGGLGSLNYTTSSPGSNFESSITIIGKKGVIKIGGEYMDTILNSTVPLINDSNIKYKDLFLEHNENIRLNNHEKFYLDVAKKLKTNIYSHDVDAVKVIDIIERIHTVIYNNKHQLLMQF